METRILNRSGAFQSGWVHKRRQPALKLQAIMGGAGGGAAGGAAGGRATLALLRLGFSRVPEQEV